MRKVLPFAVLALLGLGFWSCGRSFDNWEAASTESHREARRAFNNELPDVACLTEAMITPVAEARGWKVQPVSEFHWCHKPGNVTAWLRVTVEPPLPFSTEDENAAFFAFDEQGCSVPWNYASGVGTTCPDF